MNKLGKIFEFLKKDYKFWLIFITLVIFGITWLYFNQSKPESALPYQDSQYKIYLEKKSERDTCLENARQSSRWAIEGAIKQNYNDQQFKSVLDQNEQLENDCYRRFPL